jgi:Leucine-rich repeat (LRR) protein
MRFRSGLLAVVLAPNCAVFAADKLDESQAIREIERLGGNVKRDDKLPDRPVTAVDFSRSQRVEELKDLKNLTTLDLSETKITDAGLKELRELKKLASLSLANTQITDTGLKKLQKSLPTVRIHP